MFKYPNMGVSSPWFSESMIRTVCARSLSVTKIVSEQHLSEKCENDESYALHLKIFEMFSGSF